MEDVVVTGSDLLLQDQICCSFLVPPQKDLVGFKATTQAYVSIVAYISRNVNSHLRILDIYGVVLQKLQY